MIDGVVNSSPGPLGGGSKNRHRLQFVYNWTGVGSLRCVSCLVGVAFARVADIAFGI